MLLLRISLSFLSSEFPTIYFLAKMARNPVFSAFNGNMLETSLNYLYIFDMLKLKVLEQLWHHYCLANLGNTKPVTKCTDYQLQNAASTYQLQTAEKNPQVRRVLIMQKYWSENSTSRSDLTLTWIRTKLNFNEIKQPNHHNHQYLRYILPAKRVSSAMWHAWEFYFHWPNVTQSWPCLLGPIRSSNSTLSWRCRSTLADLRPCHVGRTVRWIKTDVYKKSLHFLPLTLARARRFS